jgi:O-antigen ligase
MTREKRQDESARARGGDPGGDRPDQARAAGTSRTDWPVVGLLAVSLVCLPVARAAVSATWIALGLLLLWRGVRRELHVPRELVLGTCCLLITWGISIGSSIDLRGTLRGWWACAAMCVPVLAVASRRDRGPLPRALEAAWLAATLLLGAWLIFEMRAGLHLLSGPFPGLAYPMMPNPNTAAQYLLLVFAWSFAAAALAPRPAGWWRHAAWAGAALLLACTHSRAAWPAFAAVAAFSSWRARRPIMGVAAAAVFVAGNWVLPQSLWDRAVQLTRLGDVSVVGRLQGWVAALRMIARRPFTGEGLGAWQAAYPQVRSPDFPVDWPHAHSFYLSVLAETGFLGLLGFAALLWSFRRVWRAGWSAPDVLPEELGMTAALLGTALVAVFDVAWAGEPGYAFLALAAFTLRRRA